MNEPDEYDVVERLPTVEEFVSLREAAGMTPRSREGVERGLPNSLFGVVTEHEPTGETVGMGRIVGDGGTVYQITDMAVHPDHQRRGLGTRVMEAILDYLEREAPSRAYVNLFADVEGFYERFGFEETRPASKGMYRRMP
jgi:ribosomal protein S18 acetylase RimI-like enzyme